MIISLLPRMTDYQILNKYTVYLHYIHYMYGAPLRNIIFRIFQMQTYCKTLLKFISWESVPGKRYGIWRINYNNVCRHIKCPIDEICEILSKSVIYWFQYFARRARFPFPVFLDSRSRWHSTAVETILIFYDFIFTWISVITVI